MTRWYPSLEDVLTFHEDQIRRYGGSPGVRDMALVEMALYRPQSGYYKDIIEEASAMWESFMMNHPFVDGNKRTAVDVTFTFLIMNGFTLVPESDEIKIFIYSLFDSNNVSFKTLDAWLRQNIRAL